MGLVRPQDKVGCIVSVEPGFKMSHLSSLIENPRISLPFNQKKQKIKERKMMLIVDWWGWLDLAIEGAIKCATRGARGA